jgi:sugar O-acyltransferase (sialic acid O-acetyltransferase NeuD family)
MAGTLLLIAASGLAREALAMIRKHGQHTVVGFLDDAPGLAGAIIEGTPVLGPSDIVTRYPEAQLLVCAGHGAVRERVVMRLKSLGIASDRYASVIHPSVEIPDGVAIGAGSIILAGVAITTAAKIGEHVVIMPNSIVTHDCVLEDYATICAGAALGGSVVVRHGAYLGMNSSVRERVVIGAGATLGMGSVLLNDIPAGEKWAGVPARAMASRNNSNAPKATGDL